MLFISVSAEPGTRSITLKKEEERNNELTHDGPGHKGNGPSKKQKNMEV